MRLGSLCALISRVPRTGADLGRVLVDPRPVEPGGPGASSLGSVTIARIRMRPGRSRNIWFRDVGADVEASAPAVAVPRARNFSVGQGARVRSFSAC